MVPSYRFPKDPDLFGAVKMSVTIISAGSQHNVVPAQCRFTVDIRVTDRYTNEEVLEIIREHVQCEVTPRSTRAQAVKYSAVASDRTGRSGPRPYDVRFTDHFGPGLLDIPSLKLVSATAPAHTAPTSSCT